MSVRCCPPRVFSVCKSCVWSPSSRGGPSARVAGPAMATVPPPGQAARRAGLPYFRFSAVLSAVSRAASWVSIWARPPARQPRCQPAASAKAYPSRAQLTVSGCVCSIRASKLGARRRDARKSTIRVSCQMLMGPRSPRAHTCWPRYQISSSSSWRCSRSPKPSASYGWCGIFSLPWSYAMGGCSMGSYG